MQLDATQPTPVQSKKGKKISWKQCNIGSTYQSKVQYINACFDALIQNAAQVQPSDPYRPGLVKSFSPMVVSIKYANNGFPALKLENDRGLWKNAEDAEAKLASESQRSVHYIYPHSHVQYKCTFCQVPITSTRIEHAYYEPNLRSPWFVCCANCRPVEQMKK